MPESPEARELSAPEAPADELNAAWVRYAAGDLEAASLALWLELTCATGEGVASGLALRFDASDQAETVAWPEGQPSSNALRELAESVLAEQCGLVAELKSEPRPGGSLARYAIGLPLLHGAEAKGCACLEIEAASDSAVQAAMGRLQWAVTVLEQGLYRDAWAAARTQAENLNSVIEIFAGLLAIDSAQKACMQLVTELAEKFDCEKVSLGFVKRRLVRIEAVSHSAQHEKKMALLRRIENAMHEAIVQRKAVLCRRDAEPGALIVREHLLLLDDDEVSSVLTVPLYDGEEYYGAICYERAGEQPFSSQQLQLAESIAQIAGLLLKRKRAESASIVHKNVR
ncbi:MAG TPA: GAF domain-containing protein, partial [Gammaproteobacteria bacterium]